MSERARRGWAWALILGHLLLTVAFSALNPLGEAPDEADHWSFIYYLAMERELPVGPQFTQSKHPPLYHASAAAVAWLSAPGVDFLRSNPDVELAPRPGWSPNFFIHTSLEEWPWQGGALSMHLVRLWSALLSTLAVAATYGLLRAALPRWPEAALAGTALLAFLPEFAFIGGAVTNDNAAALCAALALWGGVALYCGGGRFRAAWWTPLALGLGLLAKTSTVGVWPAVALGLLLGAYQAGEGGTRNVHWGRALRTGLLVFAPAVAIAAPWLARNWRLYGDPLGMALVRETVDLRTGPWGWGETVWLLRGWFVSFWGRFGGAGHIPMAAPVYWLLGGLALLALAGVARAALRRPDTRASLALLALAAAGVAAAMAQYSLVALGTDQGRLLFPAAGALAGLLGVGWLAWLPARRQGAGLAAVAAAMLCLSLYALFSVIRPAFAPPPTAAAELAALPAQPPVVWSELELAGWTLGAEPALYWRAREAPTEDWRAWLRVVAEDGSVVWEWRRSPGAGRWSTDRWPAGAVVADRYAIRWPDHAAPGAYQVEVGLEPFGGELLPPGGSDRPGDRPFVVLGRLER